MNFIEEFEKLTEHDKQEVISLINLKDKLTIQKLQSQIDEVKEWMKSLIDEDNYNPLDWVNYDDDPRYAVDKTIAIILSKLEKVGK